MTVFSWDITSFCNFSCPYCCYPVIRQGSSAVMPAARINDAWEWVHAIYGHSLIYVTGGEPFAYPGFTALAVNISRFHRLHITTNLSFPLDQFVAQADPSKVALNATFHPLYAELEVFKDHVTRLKQAGFSCDVCYLAHPSQLREMIRYKRHFFAHGIEMAITTFWGEWNGRTYPHEYTAQEREFIDYATRYDDDCAKALAVRQQPPAYNSTDTSVLKIVPEPAAGILCRAGSSYAAIGQDGSVRRCGQSGTAGLGNLYDKTMRLSDDPSPCAAVFCKNREINYSQMIPLQADTI